jgi:hypothetical protein
MSTPSHGRAKALVLFAAIPGLGAAAVAVGYRSATAADDHGDQAQGATMVTPGMPMDGEIGTIGDVDWFALNGPAASPLQVTVAGEGVFLPRVDLYDGAMQLVAMLPGPGTQMTGPTSYVTSVGVPVPPPMRIRVWSQNVTGRYRVVVMPQGDAGGVVVPPEPDAKEEPKPPASPTDDVPDGTLMAITAAFDGRLDPAGDSDGFSYRPPVDGEYVVTLTSADLTDVAADGAIPGQNGSAFQVGSWYAQPLHRMWTTGTEVHILVHSLSDAVGTYRLEITAPAAAPPPPPPPATPADGELEFDPVNDMLAKASRLYASYLNTTYRLRDGAASSEGVAALAMRLRWIQRDGNPALKTAKLASTQAIDAALASFGGRTGARRNYPIWLAERRAAVVPGGGGLSRVVDTVRNAVTARRPLILFGKHAGDGYVEAWVVTGIKTVGPVMNLVAFDPSTPGRSVLLPLGGAGVMPVGAGATLMTEFTLVGLEKDDLP